MSGNKGFTLIELLIVASLLGVVSLAVYGSLSAGVRLWRQMEKEERSNDLMLAWKRFQKDVRGRVSFKAIPFTGTDAEFSFAALVPIKEKTEGDEPAESHNEVGRIRYYRDASCNCLCRERIGYVDVMTGKAGECFPVFSDVGTAVFEYYGQEKQNEGPGAWTPEWLKDFPPLAVRLKINEKQFTTILP